MINQEEIKEALLDNKYISEMDFLKSKSYKSKSYQIIFFCKLEVEDRWIPIIIGVPDNWELNLFDIYWEGENSFIPHLERNGKFCLFDLEGSLIDVNFAGLINQCINRARDIVIEGETGENKLDFLEEFDSYFLLLDNLCFAEVVMPAEKSIDFIIFSKIKYKVNQKKGEKYAAYLKREKNNKSRFFASADSEDFKTWGVNLPQQKGLYIYVEPDSYIYPPDYQNFNGLEYINKIFQNIGVNGINKFLKKHSDELFLVFEIKQNEEIFTCFAFYLKNPQFEIVDSLRLISVKEIVPIYVSRIDEQFLQNRTSYSYSQLANKSYLLIGCGSIGGYIFHTLIKAGCKNITIVDHDKLSTENIYRHLLGREYIGNYKTYALSRYAESNLPNLKITTIDEKIEDAVIDCGLDFQDFDYIIAATGNHNVNLWINRAIVKDEIKVPVIYIWNEPLDIGSHVALFTYNSNDTCFETLFLRDENGTLYDKSSFCEKGQVFAKTYSGCNGTFIPYGSTTSIQSSILFMDLLKMHVNKSITKNVIVSEKGNDFYFKEAGFKVSDRYMEQKEKVSFTIISTDKEGEVPYA